MKKTLIIALIALANSLAFAEKIELTGDISGVIVYRGQALVTRSINTDLPAGTSEIIINNLPARIIPESLYSQSPDNLKVLSVRYREQALREDTREEVKQIDAQLAKLADEQRHLASAEKLVDARSKRYLQLWNFSVEGSKKDFSESILQVDSVKDLTGHIDEKVIALHSERLKIQDRTLEIKKETELLNRKRNTLAAGHSRTNRQAVLHVNKTGNSNAVIELSYLVTGANWSPQYNLRADAINASALIEYNAIVHQSSGETWNNTAIALSTAEPTLVASSPILNPMQITLTAAMHNRRNGRVVNDAELKMPAMSQQAEQYYFEDRTKDFDSLLKLRNSNISKGLAANSTLNEISFSNQIIEFNADKKMQQKMQARVAIIKRTEGVSVMYKLDGKLTMPSRTDQQLLNIATIKTKADYTLVAAPLLTDHVYLQAQILNDSDTILLPGTSSMYRNGEFVGKGSMQLVTMGQKFIAGFGVDSQVKVTREFTDKKVETLWGNRVDEQSYKLSINNYKNTPVKLRLLDRVPHSKNPNIEILTTAMSHKLSTDIEYLRTEKDKGILRWDLQLKPNSTDSTATVIDYSYSLKYDNDMTIQTIKN